VGVPLRSTLAFSTAGLACRESLAPAFGPAPGRRWTDYGIAQNAAVLALVDTIAIQFTLFVTMIVVLVWGRKRSAGPRIGVALFVTVRRRSAASAPTATTRRWSPAPPC